MTQHDCSRPGCTRLTSEQECDIHAAEPAGVIHEAKEPRPGVLAGTPPLVVTYRNWRGEVRERRITPRAVWFGSTHWHPERQWMLDATDEETGDLRTFAFAGFNPSKTSNSSDSRIEAWRALDAEGEVSGRAYTVKLMRTVAHRMLTATAASQDLLIAAAALEALAEPRP